MPVWQTTEILPGRWSWIKGDRGVKAASITIDEDDPVITLSYNFVKTPNLVEPLEGTGVKHHGAVAAAREQRPAQLLQRFSFGWIDTYRLGNLHVRFIGLQYIHCTI
jgi:hypothetical protein